MSQLNHMNIAVSGPWIDIKAYGAKGDGRSVTDGAISGTQTLLTCATSTPFTAADVGKTIAIAGAGVAGATLQTTIASYVSSSQIHTTVAASTGVSGALTGWGTDDTTAIQAALTAAGVQANKPQNQGSTVFIPLGYYIITSTLTVPPYVNVTGQGVGSQISQITNGQDGIHVNNGFNSSLSNFYLLSEFVVDGGNASGTSSGTGLYIHNSPTIRLSNIWVAGFTYAGYLFDTITELRAAHLVADQINGPAFSFVTLAQNCVLTDCLVGSCQGAGFDLSSVYTMSLIGCKVSSTSSPSGTSGFRLNNTQGVSLTSCISTNARQHGFIVGDVASCLDTMFTNCIAMSNSAAGLNTYDGFHIDHSDRTTLSNCSTYGSNQGHGYLATVNTSHLSVFGGHYEGGTTPTNDSSVMPIIIGDTSTGARVVGHAADGASAVGAVIDNASALATSGAKILSVRNAGTEEAFVDYQGSPTFNAGTFKANLTIGSSLANQLLAYGNSTGNPVYLQAVGSDGAIQINLIPKGGAAVEAQGSFISTGNIQANGTQVIAGGGIANQAVLSGNTSTNPAQIYGIGSDTDVGIQLVPKGAGTVQSPNLKLSGSTGTIVSVPQSGYISLQGTAIGSTPTVGLTSSSSTVLSFVTNSGIPWYLNGPTLVSQGATAGSNAITLTVAGERINFNNSGNWLADDGSGGLKVNSKVTNYNATATAGLGVSPIVAYGTQTTSTNGTVLTTFTPGATGLFEIGGFINLTAWTSGNVSIQLTYTDGHGTFQGIGDMLGANGTGGTVVTHLTGGTGTMQLFSQTIAAGSGGAISLFCALSGTATADFYGFIKQIA